MASPGSWSRASLKRRPRAGGRAVPGWASPGSWSRASLKHCRELRHRRPAHRLSRLLEPGLIEARRRRPGLRTSSRCLSRLLEPGLIEAAVSRCRCTAAVLCLSRLLEPGLIEATAGASTSTACASASPGSWSRASLKPYRSGRVCARCMGCLSRLLEPGLIEATAAARGQSGPRAPLPAPGAGPH